MSLIVAVDTDGGGGFGDPLERPLRHIAADIAAKYVTRAHAERDYGVVFAEDGSIDESETATRRAGARAGRDRSSERPA